jgi:hypothetical protein
VQIGEEGEENVREDSGAKWRRGGRKPL